MNRFARRAAVVLAVLVAALTPAVSVAQPGVGPGTFYLGTVPPSSSQSTLRVNTGVSPQRTEAGCETDRVGGTIVNGLRFVGAASGSAPTVSTIPCTGGDTNINLTLAPAGTGTVVLGGVHTFTQFFSAPAVCTSDAPTTFVQTVVATPNNVALARTATGNETINISCQIPLLSRTTTSKGSRLDAFGIAHQITGANLAGATFGGLQTLTYANNAAVAIAAYGGTVTITMPTATQTDPYLTAATLSAPAFMNTANTQVRVGWQVQLVNGGTYRLYGISATFSTALY